MAIDDTKNAGRQLFLFEQPTEVEDGGFIRNALQTQPCKMVQASHLPPQGEVAWSGR